MHTLALWFPLPMLADAVVQVECQFLEIHNDDIRDLLHPRGGAGSVRRPSAGLALRYAPGLCQIYLRPCIGAAAALLPTLTLDPCVVLP